MKNKKLILTDVDGVLLDWSKSFIAHMEAMGYPLRNPGVYSVEEAFGIDEVLKRAIVADFNRSKVMLSLEPLPFAVEYVRKLHEEFGFTFGVITSQTDDALGQAYRIKNLVDVFGADAFDFFEILSTGADKDEALEKFRGQDLYWVEDKPENAEAGAQVGLKALLVQHDHNADHFHNDVMRVENWKDVYDIIKENMEC